MSRGPATVAMPVYEEGPVIRRTLTELFTHMTTDLVQYEWEIVVVDDGSHDRSIDVIVMTANDLHLPIRVLAHDRNYGLGGALSTIFREAHGQVIVTVDADLTYSADHIAPLLAAFELTGAAVVVASPYMEGGATRGVPRSLELRSRIANRYLAAMTAGRIATFTGIVRAYDADFARSVPPLVGAAGANVQVLHEAWRQKREVIEIPARLDWSGQLARRGRHRVFAFSALHESAHVLKQGVQLRRVTRLLETPGRAVAPSSQAGTPREPDGAVAPHAQATREDPVTPVREPGADRPEGFRAS